MKQWLKAATSMVALAVVATGCGKSSEDPNANIVSPVHPYPNNGSYPVTPGSGLQVYFSGSNAYVNPTGKTLIGGQISSAVGTKQSIPCGYNVGINGRQYGGTFTNKTGSWCFANLSKYTSFLYTSGGMNMNPGTPGVLTFTGNSAAEPGISITVVASQPQQGFYSNQVAGVLTLSPAFVSSRFGGVMPQVTGVAFDLVTGHGQNGVIQVTGGGAILHTTQNSYYVQFH